MTAYLFTGSIVFLSFCLGTASSRPEGSPLPAPERGGTAGAPAQADVHQQDRLVTAAASEGLVDFEAEMMQPVIHHYPNKVAREIQKALTDGMSGKHASKSSRSFKIANLKHN